MSKCEKRCKDCIHCEVCEHNSFLVQFDKNNIAYCTTFKDKSLVVELPVTRGQKVYVTDYEPNEIVECEIIGSYIDGVGTERFVYKKRGEIISIDVPVSRLGETVFLKREEAEAKLNKKMTNYEKITQSVESLAEFIETISIKDISKERIVQWLLKEEDK